MLNTKEIIEEVSLLPIEERAMIIDSLIKTLNPIKKNNEKEWIKMAKKRLNEIKIGKVKTIDGETVFKKVLDKYKKCITISIRMQKKNFMMLLIIMKNVK